jgi:hypothetical protein
MQNLAKVASKGYFGFAINRILVKLGFTSINISNFEQGSPYIYIRINTYRLFKIIEVRI